VIRILSSRYFTLFVLLKIRIISPRYSILESSQLSGDLDQFIKVLLESSGCEGSGSFYQGILIFQLLAIRILSSRYVTIFRLLTIRILSPIGTVF
jgi:hypothetical protein